MVFKVGDRVQKPGKIFGTVMCVHNGGVMCVKRDDGTRGGGHNRYWSASVEYWKLIGPRILDLSHIKPYGIVGFLKDLDNRVYTKRKKK